MAIVDEGDSANTLSPDASLSDEATTVDLERSSVLSALSAGKFDTLQERVAWILNHYPQTRNSDIALQLQYWTTFQSDLAGGNYINKDDLYSLARLTSLTRARAKIQNTYRLFLAAPDVRKQRGTLSEEEKEKAVKEQPVYPMFAVYGDESGKDSAFLIVGSVWVLHPPELIRIMLSVQAWKESHKFDGEFHFHGISAAKLPDYYAFADFLTGQSAALSFKAVSVERAGIGNVDKALAELYYLLLVRGVEHEHTTGRAPLPRGLQLWKDQEEVGKDKLFLAGLRERVSQAAETQFDGNLSVDLLEAIDSKGQVLIQVADLFTSSIHRVLNAAGKREGPKDQFADYLLGRLGIPKGPANKEVVGQMAVHFAL